jgi:hypothetical protein
MFLIILIVGVLVFAFMPPRCHECTQTDKQKMRHLLKSEERKDD